MKWDEEVNVGDWLVFESYVAVNPEVFREFYNDRFLKEYATVVIKKQWATNLSKFEGLQLPGGVQFNAQQMLSEANEEKNRLEEELSLKYELPPDFMTG